MTWYSGESYLKVTHWHRTSSRTTLIGNTAKDHGSAVGYIAKDHGSAVGHTAKDNGSAVGHTAKDHGSAVGHNPKPKTSESKTNCIRQLFVLYDRQHGNLGHSITVTEISRKFEKKGVQLYLNISTLLLTQVAFYRDVWVPFPRHSVLAA